MFSSTFHYGLHHLAHHQFVNDPVRDPDISQLQKSGHRLSFPILKQEFMEVLFRQMWVPNLVRYSLARAEYDSLGTEHNPYIREDWEFSKLPQRLTRGVFGSCTALLLAALVMYGNAVLLAVLPVVAWAGIMLVLGLLPERYYYQSKIRPLFSIRSLGMMRTTFITALFCALGVGDVGHGRLVGGVLFPALGAAAGHVVSAVHGAAADRAAWQRRPWLAHQ